ncbi:unnamed protein product [Danaus chrysippus]|uniref:(African queen) hypothetical protein n=1 Tax=Danaus chrysippus TaxID=151541 RepID=A0A8J2QIM9_9NEOP|nr:unnamed protein product [Danaus chrysippus]
MRVESCRPRIRAGDLAAGEWLCALAFTDEVDHLIKLFLLVVEVQGLHAALEVGRREAFGPENELARYSLTDT